MAVATRPLHKEGTVDSTLPACFRFANGLRPWWMLTDYAMHEWVVRDTGDKPNRLIRFDIVLRRGRRLSDFPHLLETVKRIVFGIRHGPMMRIESGSVQVERAASLLTLVRWMDINGIHRFSDLTASDQWEYAQLAVGGVHEILNTEGTLTSYLQALTAKAAFSEVDSPVARRLKSLQALPLRRLDNGRVELNREQLLCDAGLDGVRLQSGSALLRTLDNFEMASGLYVGGDVRARAHRHVDVDAEDERRVTSESLRRLLIPFRLLYEHRYYADDALAAPPFEGQALKDIANRLGSEIGRTGTIPVKQATTLIERSIRWVLDYAPDILEAKDAVDRGHTIVDDIVVGPTDQPASPFPISLKKRVKRAPQDAADSVPPMVPDAAMTLHAALNFLATACSIVIAAFSARRAAEIVGLHAGCIDRDDAGKPWLQSFVHKTLQSYGKVPVPEVVVAATDVLCRLSARAREITAQPYIFQFNLPGTDTVVGLSSDGSPVFRIGHFFREFGYFVDVPPLEDGSRWTFHPHQFRRFFAVMYVWGYELSDLGALAHHLRHINLEMTRRYVTDTELGGILHQANQERTAEILVGVALGNRQLFGDGGHRLSTSITKLSARLARQVQVVPARKIHQRIMRFVERTGLTLKALPWGYCASPEAAHADARCVKGPEVANTARASVATCAGCKHNVRSAEFHPYLQQTLELHRALGKAADAPLLLRRASEALCREIQAYMVPLTGDPSVQVAAK